MSGLLLYPIFYPDHVGFVLFSDCILCMRGGNGHRLQVYITVQMGLIDKTKYKDIFDAHHHILFFHQLNVITQ